ncbi:MAG: hypothetical protein OXH50_15495, partial [Gemmatimonadetes bacterium]|nr:hypothetical protein [Gemmatimonadota bacterium]
MSEDNATHLLDFAQEFEALVDQLPDWGAAVGTSLLQALDAGEGNWFAALLAVLAVGYVGERLLCRKLNSLSLSFRDQRSSRWYVVFGYAAFRLLFDLVGVLLFWGLARVTQHLILDASTAFSLTLGNLIGAIVQFRVLAVVSRTILAPKSESIRPVAISNEDARAYHRWAILFIGSYVFLTFFVGVLAGAMSPVLIRATVVLVGGSLLLIFVAFVWSSRQRLARLFLSRP